jgi:hypothetical protein
MVRSANGSARSAADDRLRASPDDASHRRANREARLWPTSFETTAPRSPQDEE